MPTTNASQTDGTAPDALKLVAPPTSSMRSVFGPMFRHGAMYSLAIAAAKFSSFLLLPVYTRYLTPTDYGTMELLDLTCHVATSLVSMRLADSMLYHYFNERTEYRRQTVLSTAFLGSFLIGGVAAGLGWMASPVVSRLVFTSEQYSFYFQLVFLSVGLSIPQGIGYTYLRAQNRSGLFCAVSLARLVFQITLMLWLLVLQHLGFAAMVWTSLITYGVEALCASWYVLRPIRISFDLGLFRKLTAYGAPLAIGSLGMLVLHFGDRYFLQRRISLGEIGIYALAYKIGMLVAHAQTPFMQHWNAQMFTIMQRSDGRNVYVRTTTYFTVLYLFVTLALALFSRPLLHLMATPAYYGAAAFVPAVALAYLVRGLGDYFRSILLLEKRTSLDGMITTGGAVVCVLLYALLIPRLGAWGAVLSTLTAFGLMLPLSVWQSQRVKWHAFEWKRMAVAIVCAGGVYAAGSILLFRGIGPETIVAGVFTLLFPVVLFLAGFFDSAEKMVLCRILGRVRVRVVRLRAELRG